MARKILFLAVAWLLLFGWVIPLSAQYILTLKNGRRITVQSYREEGPMIKFFGLGGEIGISRDQIQSIRKAGEEERGGTNVFRADRPASAPTVTEPKPEVPPESSPASPPATPEKAISEEERLAEQKAKEEKEYQQRVKELTEGLKDARERYALLTRGTTGTDPSFFTSEEAFRGHQEDLLSRLRDAQYKAQGLETGHASGSPPFSLSPPPAYTEKQKELSHLRNQISTLENERQKLIDEMKQKGFDTGSLFLE